MLYGLSQLKLTKLFSALWSYRCVWEENPCEFIPMLKFEPESIQWSTAYYKYCELQKTSPTSSSDIESGTISPTLKTPPTLINLHTKEVCGSLCKVNWHYRLTTHGSGGGPLDSHLVCCDSLPRNVLINPPGRYEFFYSYEFLAWPHCLLTS